MATMTDADMHLSAAPATADDRRRRLTAALTLVEQMAEMKDSPVPLADGQVAAAYAAAAPIARRRFDAVADEAGAFAASGIAALIRHREAKGSDCAAAAEQLARDMRQSLAIMDRLVPPA